METPSSPTIRRCTAARGAHRGIDKEMATFSKAGRTMFKVMNHVPALETVRVTVGCLGMGQDVRYRAGIVRP